MFLLDRLEPAHRKLDHRLNSSLQLAVFLAKDRYTGVGNIKIFCLVRVLDDRPDKPTC